MCTEQTHGRRPATGPTIEMMDVDALLRKQDWKEVTARLSGFAYRRLRPRSWEKAEELAQEAIARAYEAGQRDSHYQVWDPERQPLMNYLMSRVCGLMNNESRARRNACEVALDYEAELIASDAALADEVLDRRGYAVRFRDTLFQELAGDQLAFRIATMMEDGVTGEGELARELGCSVAEVRAARKRIHRVATRVTEMVSSASPGAGGAGRAGSGENRK